MENQDKIQIIKNEIDQCSMFEYQEIYNIIRKNNANYSKNINGIFIDLQRLDDITIDQIYNYIIYCNKLTKNINEFEDIKNNIIKNNLDNIEEIEENNIVDNNTIEEDEESPTLPLIKNKVSSTMKFYILKKKLTKTISIFSNNITNNLDYDTPYKV
jgi:hypothetical protein